MLLFVLLTMVVHSDSLPDNKLMSNIKLLFRKRMQTPSDDPSFVGCPWQDVVKISYDYSGKQYQYVFYTMIECLDAQQKFKNNRTFYSYVENELGTELPQGCPPPIIPSTEDPDECGKGKSKGKKLAKIIASLTVPLMMRKVSDNPLQQTVAFKDYIANSWTSVENLSTEQEQILTALVKAAFIEAEKKLKCFIDIFELKTASSVKEICVKVAAEQNLEEEVGIAVIEQLSCGSVGCLQYFDYSPSSNDPIVLETDVPKPPCKPGESSNCIQGYDLPLKPEVNKSQASFRAVQIVKRLLQPLINFYKIFI